IAQEFPHLAERYRNTYGSSAYAGEKYREGLARFFEKLCARYGVRGWSSRYDEEGDESPDSALVPSVHLSLEMYSEPKARAPGRSLLRGCLLLGVMGRLHFLRFGL